MDKTKIKRQQKNITTIETIVDRNSGEVISEAATVRSSSTEPDFVKMYLHDVGRLCNLKKDTNKTLLALLRKMNYDNEVVLASTIKKELAEALKIKINTLEHAIGDLVKSGILYRVANNHYEINPLLIAKGSWKDIQLLRMNITYSPEGRIIKTDTSFQVMAQFPEA